MSSEELERILGRWMRFMGYGNPDANLIVMGVEEGGGFTDQSEIITYLREVDAWSEADAILRNGLRLYCDAFAIDDHWARLDVKQGKRVARRPSSVWQYTSKLLACMEGTAIDTKALRYSTLPARQREIFAKDSLVFVANAFPLGKYSVASWPYELVGISRARYEQKLREERIPALRALKGERSIVVAHGLVAHWLVQAAYKVQNDIPVMYGCATVFPRSRLVCCPFFSNRSMGISRLREVVDAVQLIKGKHFGPDRAKANK